MDLMIENNSLISNGCNIYIDGVRATDVTKVVLTLELDHVVTAEITRAVKSLIVDVKVDDNGDD